LQLNLKGWAMQAGLKFNGYPTPPEPILELMLGRNLGRSGPS
jgi:hypothetical protein